MNGKILNVSKNDLNGNQDDRKVMVFACFEHTKYMNNYIVFSIVGEEGKKRLCYGSVHLKKNSLVTFSIKDSLKKYIDEFLDEYITDELKEFKLIDINDMSKIELVSYNEMEYDKIDILKERSIVRDEIVNEELNKKKPVFLYLLVLFLFCLLGGLIYIYFNPDVFLVKYKQLVCKNDLYDQKIDLNYNIEKDIKFDENDKVNKINVVRTYIFLDSTRYYEFKENKEYEKYFSSGEGYKFIDEELKFKVFYEENSIIDDYDEMYSYMEKEGFSCIKKEYEK